MDIQYHIRTVDQTKLHHFRNTDLCKLFLSHIPVLIAFIDKVLKTDPYGMLQILDHIR